MMPVDVGCFRQSMRRIAATVCILSTQTPQGRRGITVSSVSSLTAEPPAICFALHKFSSFYTALSSPGLVCVNVLARGQDEIGAAFAAPIAAHERFSTGIWDALDVSRYREPGEHMLLPVLRDAQVNIVAEIRHDAPYGTHHLCIAEVKEIYMADQIDPLIYCDGKYRSLKMDE